MSKRTAETELNHDNWDNEDVPEEAGAFKKASDAELGSRIIRKARRSNTSLKPESSQSSGLFKSVSLVPQNTTSIFSPFQFNLSKTDTVPVAPDIATSTTSVDTSPDVASGTRKFNNPPDVAKESLTVKPLPDVAIETSDASSSNTKTLELHTAIICLNKAFLKSIQNQLEDTADKIINLAPSCKSYLNHIENLKAKHEDFTKVFVEKSPTVSSRNSSKNTFSNSSNFSPKFSFNVNEKLVSKDNKPSFNFGKLEKPLNEFKPTFGNMPSSNEPFKFQMAASSSKTSPDIEVTTTSVPSTNTGEDENYIPPEPEKKVVTEEGSEYSVKTKLFFMLNNNWNDKGVGMAFLKKTNNGVQLIIRAENTMATIMLNCLLKSDLEITKSGKNNLTFIVVPSPPLNKKEPDRAYPTLLKVKDCETADEFLKNINELRS